VAFIHENKSRIYRLCRAYAGDTQEQQDLFQEVVFNLWKAKDSFRGDAQESTWLYRVTLNVCLRYALQRNRQAKVRLESVQFVSREHNAQQQLEQEEQVTLLYNCISKLNEIDRTVVLLYMEDVPYRQVADITGLTENNIAQRVSRIKSKLLQCLKKFYHA
jgi:RNA polymerase sigma-70 factor (ECF subfamily)